MSNRPGGARRWFATCFAAAAGACVTTYEPAPLLLASQQFEAPPPVTIPFPAHAGSAGRVGFYSRVLEQLQDAAEAGDVALIDGLLAAYDQPDLPTAWRETLRSYRGVARGLRFSAHARANARLQLTRPGEPSTSPVQVPPLGEPLRLELQLSAPADPVVLGGGGDAEPIVFQVALSVEDRFVDGSSTRSQLHESVPLERAVELAGTAVLTLPIGVDLPPGEAFLRTIEVQVDLMPGYVGIAGEPAPVQRTTLATGSYACWPAGAEQLQAQPLAALQQALSRFVPTNFGAAWVATLALPADQREQAVAALVEQVRFGGASQALVASALLVELTGASVAIGDRDGWLAWWQARR